MATPDLRLCVSYILPICGRTGGLSLDASYEDLIVFLLLLDRAAAGQPQVYGYRRGVSVGSKSIACALIMRMIGCISHDELILNLTSHKIPLHAMACLLRLSKCAMPQDLCSPALANSVVLFMHCD